MLDELCVAVDWVCRVTGVCRNITLGTCVDGGAVCVWGFDCQQRSWGCIVGLCVFESLRSMHICWEFRCWLHTLPLKVLLGDGWRGETQVHWLEQECLCAGPQGTTREARFTPILFKWHLRVSYKVAVLSVSSFMAGCVKGCVNACTCVHGTAKYVRSVVWEPVCTRERVVRLCAWAGR